MTTLNTTPTDTFATSAKAQKPTLEQRRRADLAEGVIRLSPSSLTFLWDECPACFWHHYNGRPRPATAFPKVFGALDAAQKDFFVGRSTKEVAGSLPAGKIERGKRVRSEAIAVPGTNYRVQFSGDTDTILRFSRAGYGVCDFKTSTPSPEAASLYGRQLHAYAIALERPAGEAMPLAPVSRLGLICFPPGEMVDLAVPATPATRGASKSPSKAARTGTSKSPSKAARTSPRQYAYRTSAVWVEVERNDAAYFAFLADVVRLVTRTTAPRSAPNCGWCRWTKMTAPLYIAAA